MFIFRLSFRDKSTFYKLYHFPTVLKLQPLLSLVVLAAVCCVFSRSINQIVVTEKPNKQKVKHVSDQQKVYTTVNDKPVCSEATAHNLLYIITANTRLCFFILTQIMLIYVAMWTSLPPKSRSASMESSRSSQLCITSESGKSITHSQFRFTSSSKP